MQLEVKIKVNVKRSDGKYNKKCKKKVNSIEDQATEKKNEEEIK
jgi:hypothetical protein